MSSTYSFSARLRHPRRGERLVLVPIALATWARSWRGCSGAWGAEGAGRRCRRSNARESLAVWRELAEARSSILTCAANSPSYRRAVGFANATRLAGAGSLDQAAAARSGQVRVLRRGVDVVEIGRADFFEQRVLFDAEECHLPVAGGAIGVAVGGATWWRRAFALSRERRVGRLCWASSHSSTSRARSFTRRGTPASRATWMP